MKGGRKAINGRSVRGGGRSFGRFLGDELGARTTSGPSNDRSHDHL
jgi:hypothetical protein